MTQYVCRRVNLFDTISSYAFTGTFRDNCSVWIGQDGLSLKMSHTSPDGLVVEMTDEGLMYQVLSHHCGIS